MNITRMRSLLRKRGQAAVPVVAFAFACHYAKRNRTKTAAVVMLGAGGLAFLSCCGSQMPYQSAKSSGSFFLPDSAAVQEAAYDVTDLGTLGGKFSFASAVNNRGQAAGTSHNAQEEARGYVWNSGKMTDTGTLGGDLSAATGMNNSGEAVGLSNYSASDEYIHAFAWRNGAMTKIEPGNAVASIAYGINDSGAVVGAGLGKDDRVYGFLRKEGKTTRFFLLHSDFTVAQAINESGMIACYAGTSGKIKSFLIRGEKHQDLPGLNGEDCFAQAINERGDAAGTSFLDESDTLHAVIWRNGKPIDLGTLPGLPESGATSINREGIVVGAAFAPQDEDERQTHPHTKPSDLRHPYPALMSFRRSEPLSPAQAVTHFGEFRVRYAYPQDPDRIEVKDQNKFPHAFIWRDGKMTDLNRLLPSGSDWILIAATGISDRGQITGIGLHDGKFRAFLLSPKR